MNEPTVTAPTSVPYFQRLHELFDRVVDLPPGERDAEIDRIALSEPTLAHELRALLEHADRSDSPLDDVAVRVEEEIEPPLPRISGFRLHRSIGRGGSSTVYLADQEHADFTRTVALKVVDRLFDEGSLRSVREEQRILARLEHPGIARLYDSGTTAAGRHWLAVEYVEGESILEHCRSRELSASARIELFLSVLDAVAYAHARGIVHRDLKPANIFVTANGEAKLLDFGIAKHFDPTDRDETRTLQRALTPAYASPEQMRGGRTTSASDIYSLGVVLYELLVGALPRHAGPDGVEEETEPLPASLGFARRALGGDLDAILQKALREQPDERYASATALADDLRKFLAGAPVAARRGELQYRTRKFLRRHRGVVVVVIAALLFVAAWQIASRWRDARPGNEVAIYYDAKPIDSETRRWLRDGAERLARFDGAGARDSFRRATSSSKGSVPGEALAWDGVARAESLLGEPGRAAEAAQRAGSLIADHASALPRHEAERLRARALAAKRDWNAAVAALEELFGAQPERIDVGIDLVTTLVARGRTDAADTALGRLRQIAASGDPRIDVMEAEVALQLSEFQRAAAAASRARERAIRVQAVALDQRAARAHAEAIGRLDRRDEARRELTSIATRNEALGLTGEAAVARLALGSVLLQSRGNEETRRTFEAARDGCIQAGNRRCAIEARALLAMIAGMEGNLSEAIRDCKTALADARSIGDRWCEGYVLSQLQVLYNWADDPAAIKALTEPTLAALRDSGNRRLLLTTLSNLAVASIEALDLEKAEVYVVEADGLARRVGSQLASASIDRTRGYLEETRGDVDLARKSYTSALEKARQAGVPWNIAHYLSDLAWLEVDADRPGPATERAQEAIALFTKAGDLRSAAETETVLAWVEARRGDAAAAQRHLAPLRQIAAEDKSEKNVLFSLLNAEAHVAAAAGDWRHVIELRRETARMAAEWNLRGVVIVQKASLAKALREAGDRRALEKLVAEILPEVESSGLRGVARELRALTR